MVWGNDVPMFVYVMSLSRWQVVWCGIKNLFKGRSFKFNMFIQRGRWHGLYTK